MIVYTLFFISILFACLYSIINNTNTRISKLIFLIIGITILCFAAFRGNVDRDHQNYINIYGYILNGQSYLIEPSFYLLTYISKFLVDGYYFLFVSFAMLGVGLKLYSINKLSYLPLASILVYFSNYYFLHEMTQIRAGVAIAICFLGLPSLVNRKYMSFCIYIGLASLFHYSSLLFLVLILIPKSSLNKKELMIYFLMLLLAYGLYEANIGFAKIFSYIPIDFVRQKFISYSEKANANLVDSVNVFSVFQLIKILISGFIAYSFYKNKPTSVETVLLRLYIYSIISWVMLFDIPAFAIRVSEFFGFSEVFLLPYILRVFKPRVISSIIFVLICTILFYVNIFHNELMLPYFIE